LYPVGPFGSCDLSVCISSDVLPEIKEYERTSTTVINAYVLPVVRQYCSRLRADLNRLGVTAPLHIMQSNGGLTTAEIAAERPVNIIESGPAAGVVGAQALALKMGLAKIISFDMGGTTAKASIVENGEVTRSAEYSVGAGIMIGSRLLTGAGYLLKVPAIDLAEVGAGGGSHVWIDGGGSLQVGPSSAGAVPGPVCYDIGGSHAKPCLAIPFLREISRPQGGTDGSQTCTASLSRSVRTTAINAHPDRAGRRMLHWRRRIDQPVQFDRIHTFEPRPSQASLFPARLALVFRPGEAYRSAQDPQMPPRLRAIAACATWGAISQT
jgi:hypothetical protein